MNITLQRLIAEHTQLVNSNKVLKWLIQNKHDSELVTIFIQADDHDCLDDLLVFIHWALERGIIINPDDHPDISTEDIF